MENNKNISQMPNSVIISFMWGLAVGACELDNYNDIFQEAYTRNLYNKAVIFNLHLWATYRMKQSDYHPKWLLWKNYKERGSNDSESSN